MNVCIFVWLKKKKNVRWVRRKWEGKGMNCCWNEKKWKWGLKWGNNEKAQTGFEAKFSSILLPSTLFTTHSALHCIIVVGWCCCVRAEKELHKRGFMAEKHISNEREKEKHEMKRNSFIKYSCSSLYSTAAVVVIVMLLEDCIKYNNLFLYFQKWDHFVFKCVASQSANRQ